MYKFIFDIFESTIYVEQNVLRLMIECEQKMLSIEIIITGQNFKYTLYILF